MMINYNMPNNKLYYLIYIMNDLYDYKKNIIKHKDELYAYATSKSELKKFMKYRSTIEFKYQKKYLALCDRQLLSDSHSDCRLVMRSFDVGKNKFDMTITMLEALEIERFNTYLNIMRISTATIDPIIFKRKIQKVLINTYYTYFYRNWETGQDAEFLYSTFEIFISIFFMTIDNNKLEKGINNED